MYISDSSVDNYFALDRIAFYSVRRIPNSNIGPQSRNSSTTQLMVVHNQCFSLAVRQGALTASEGTVVSPPSYDEAVAIGVRNDGFTVVPQEVSVVHSVFLFYFIFRSLFTYFV